jgi:biopolymer transport protein ExbD
MGQIKVNEVLVLVTVFLVVLTALNIFQSYQMISLNAKLSKVSTSKSGGVSAAEVLKEITPTGTPNYGEEAGVSYDKVEAGLNTLMGYHESISLSGDDQQRYIKIATTKDTACEFCSGIGNNGFGTSDGRIACGCSHNLAFSGLTKWLIKNTDYSDEQIVEEIKNWKVLFFPQGMLEEELERRNIEPETAGLSSMVGGC